MADLNLTVDKKAFEDLRDAKVEERKTNPDRPQTAEKETERDWDERQAWQKFGFLKRPLEDPSPKFPKAAELADLAERSNKLYLWHQGPRPWDPEAYLRRSNPPRRKSDESDQSETSGKSEPIFFTSDGPHFTIPASDVVEPATSTEIDQIRRGILAGRFSKARIYRAERYGDIDYDLPAISIDSYSETDSARRYGALLYLPVPLEPYGKPVNQFKGQRWTGWVRIFDCDLYDFERMYVVAMREHEYPSFYFYQRHEDPKLHGGFDEESARLDEDASDKRESSNLSDEDQGPGNNGDKCGGPAPQDDHRQPSRRQTGAPIDPNSPYVSLNSSPRRTPLAGLGQDTQQPFNTESTRPMTFAELFPEYVGRFQYDGQQPQGSQSIRRPSIPQISTPNSPVTPCYSPCSPRARDESAAPDEGSRQAISASSAQSTHLPAPTEGTRGVEPMMNDFKDDVRHHDPVDEVLGSYRPMYNSTNPYYASNSPQWHIPAISTGTKSSSPLKTTEPAESKPNRTPTYAGFKEEKSPIETSATNHEAIPGHGQSGQPASPDAPSPAQVRSPDYGEIMDGAEENGVASPPQSVHGSDAADHYSPIEPDFGDGDARQHDGAQADAVQGDSDEEDAEGELDEDFLRRVGLTQAEVRSAIPSIENADDYVVDSPSAGQIRTERSNQQEAEDSRQRSERESAPAPEPSPALNEYNAVMFQSPGRSTPPRMGTPPATQPADHIANAPTATAPSSATGSAAVIAPVTAPTIAPVTAPTTTPATTSATALAIAPVSAPSTASMTAASTTTGTTTGVAPVTAVRGPSTHHAAQPTIRQNSTQPASYTGDTTSTQSYRRGRGGDDNEAPAKPIKRQKLSDGTIVTTTARGRQSKPPKRFG
ncbi:Hypothetical protein D9617_20g027570 [Elsinoe fawcettii]|nr:Hypothetical protein D9617_20g027570 [Elsinoe fawcettii]